MSRVVFLLEERSMRILLEGLLPRLLPGLQFVCIPHEGKQDLEKSIPRKLRAWNEPGARFVVVRDNDIGDCRVLKKRLTTLCTLAGRWDTLVRIPCIWAIPTRWLAPLIGPPWQDCTEKPDSRIRTPFNDPPRSWPGWCPSFRGSPAPVSWPP